ncbi:MAG: hypothetical protein ABI572_10240 [Actinomycetota bacterium]
MSPVVAIADGVIFGIGAVIFIGVFTAALGLGYARFAELGEEDQHFGER